MKCTRLLRGNGQNLKCSLMWLPQHAFKAFMDSAYKKYSLGWLEIIIPVIILISLPMTPICFTLSEAQDELCLHDFCQKTKLSRAISLDS